MSDSWMTLCLPLHHQYDLPPLSLFQKQKDPEEQYREALADISRLLDRRRPLYGMADIAVPLEAAGTDPEQGIGAPIAEVVHRLLLALELRLTQDQNLIFREPASEDFPEAPAPIAAEE